MSTYSIRLFSSSDHDLPLAEYSQGLTWERLTEILRREVSPEAAAIFAEPVADPARGLTHWYVEVAADPIPLSITGEAERVQLLATLETRRAEILAFADKLSSSITEADARLAQALRSAVTVPDPDAHVWSISGRPVLVAWGRRASLSAPPEARIEYRRKANPAPAVLNRELEPRRDAAVQRKSERVPALRKDERLSAAAFDVPALWPILAWLVFTVFILAIYYNLLAACAIEGPLGRPLFSHCPGAKRSELQQLFARNDELRAQLRDVQARAAQGAGECRTELKPPVPDIRPYGGGGGPEHRC
ncbi:MAG: hypothetical protein L0Y50_08285 [Beijerinckiaceae bacterium]|nr:hypothetical protein [Beijerinckiaceae bacterium]MCI0736251.1 hypothetical protein [Beijerinckiaceae bacterium]